MARDLSPADRALRDEVCRSPNAELNADINADINADMNADMNADQRRPVAGVARAARQVAQRVP